MDTPLEVAIHEELDIPAGAVVGNWIIICEVLDPETRDLDLYGFTSKGVPSYTRTGMLKEAIDDIAWEEVEEEDDD